MLRKVERTAVQPKEGGPFKKADVTRRHTAVVLIRFDWTPRPPLSVWHPVHFLKDTVAFKVAF